MNERIEEFELLEQLAHGQQRVYRALDRQSNRVVTVKLGRGARDRQRLANEAIMMKRVGPPTVPSVHASGTTKGGAPYLAIEYVDGVTLANHCNMSARPPLELIEMFIRVCGRVEEIHARGIVHRDLNPTNIIIGASAITIIDLGIAHDLGCQDMPRVAGTPLFMPPEQTGGAAADLRSDVYSLGATLFHALTGRAPFVGDAASVIVGHRSRRPPALRDWGFSSELDAIVQQCLSKEATDRFTSVTSLRDEIERVAAEKRIVATSADERRFANRKAPATRADRLEVAVVISESPTAIAGQRAATLGGFAMAPVDSRSVIAFVNGSPADRIRTAMAAASSLKAAVVHCVQGEVWPSRRGPVVNLDASLEGVCPAQPHAGVLLSSAAAKLLPSTKSSVVAGYSRALDRTPIRRPPDGLIGRDRELRSLVDALERAQSTAVVCSVTGGEGYGKTALMRALESRAHNCAVETLWLESSQTPGNDTHDFIAALIGIEGRQEQYEWLAGLLGRFGEPLGVEASADLALTLGAEASKSAGTSLRLAYASRHTLARAIAAAVSYRCSKSPLAILIDDAHKLDLGVLDGLELAATSTKLPVFVCLAATPALLTLRPQFSQRWRSGVHVCLDELSDVEAAMLIRQSLEPVSLIGRHLLSRLVALTGNVPLHIVEAVEAVWRSGCVRRQGNAWVACASGFVEASPAGCMLDLAKHRLAQLPVPLRELAEICAVVRRSISANTLHEFQRRLHEQGQRREQDVREQGGKGVGEQPLELNFALSELADAGLLVERNGAFEFRHESVARAIERCMSETHRRRLHRVAVGLDFGASRQARHARGAGMWLRAAGLFLSSAESLLASDIEMANDELTQALACLTEAQDVAVHSPIGARVLRLRARARYRLQRYDEALADLALAKKICSDLLDGDDADGRLLQFDLYLEEATCHDWLGNFSSSTESLEGALALKVTLDENRQAQLAFAIGRQHWRREESDKACSVLADAAVLARAAGNIEAEVLSLLLRGPALVYARRFTEAAKCFETLIAQCTRVGDRLHLGGAYVNRMPLWSLTHQHDRVREDLDQALRIGRELGHFQLERMASYNKAEFLLWAGEFDEALPFAERSLELQRTYFEAPTAEDRMLVARIHVISGRHADGAALLRELDADGVLESASPSTQALNGALRAAIAGATSHAWHQVVETSRTESMGGELVEILYLAASGVREAAHASSWMREALRDCRNAPRWSALFQSEVNRASSNPRNPRSEALVATAADLRVTDVAC